jgi:hypothetical protein
VAATAVVAAGERLVVRMTGGLSRSFGPYGALALVSRALTRAQPVHPPLSAVKVTSESVPGLPGTVGHSARVTGLDASANSYDAATLTDAVTAWVAQLADLLGGLIGDELAATILEQSAATGMDSAAPPRNSFAAPAGAGDASATGGMDNDAPTTVDES